MTQTKVLMGMPITVAIEDQRTTEELFDRVYDYFAQVDEQFSPYKPTSEVSRINAGLPRTEWSREMISVIDMCEQTKHDTKGFFDIRRGDTIDPSGLVKGWAIQNAAQILRDRGCQNFYIDAGGDVQVSGKPRDHRKWRIGIRNPFALEEIVKIVLLTTQGVATSGTYIRGQHIYNPHSPEQEITEIASLSVIGPDIYNADRFATAAFAMGRDGIAFIQSLEGYEGYMIDGQKQATKTSGFEAYEYKESGA